MKDGEEDESNEDEERWGKDEEHDAWNEHARWR